MEKITSRLKCILSSDAFAAVCLCSLLVFGQYHLNEATRLSAECDSARFDLLALRLDRIETLLVHNDSNMIELKSQLLAHENGMPWKPFDGAEAKAAAESEANYQRVREVSEANQPSWEKMCNDFSDFKDQSALLLAVIGAILTFFGFKLGKHSERKGSLGDPIV